MKLACREYYGLKVAALFDIYEQPLNIVIQRDNALNFGEVVQARITKKDQALGGYFAETEKKAQVFIPSKKDTYGIGEEVSVQITKEARLGKEANGLILKEREPSFCPSVFSLICNDYADFTDENAGSAISGHLIEEMLDSHVRFADGAILHIERTSTCYTFDVDTGSSTRPIDKINEEACFEIAKQVLLKNISGIMLVDFAGKKTKDDRLKLSLLMHHFFYADKRTKVCAFTRSKLFELTRQRTSASLYDIFLTPSGRKNACFLAMEIQEKLFRRHNGRPVLKANPLLIKQLPQEFAALCKIVPDFRFREDEYELKGENDG